MKFFGHWKLVIGISLDVGSWNLDVIMLIFIYIKLIYMKKLIYIFLFVALSIIPSTLFAQASESALLVLKSDKTEAKAGDEVNFTIFYGNSADEAIKDSEVHLDLYVDGDTNLEFVSSSMPVQWLSSGEKRKPSWNIGDIEKSADIKNLPYISFKVKIKNSAPPDFSFACSAYLYTPQKGTDELNKETETSQITVRLATGSAAADNLNALEEGTETNQTEVLNSQTGEKLVTQGSTEEQNTAIEQSDNTEDTQATEEPTPEPKKINNAIYTLGMVFIMIVVSFIIGAIVGFILGVGKRRKYQGKE